MLQYVLRFVAGKDQGREFPLPPDLTIVIGRVSDVDLLLLDEKVSRKHAKISTHQGQVLIEDLASRNGTFVNGARIRSIELKEGDQIAIGAATIRLVSLGDAKPRVPHPAVPSAQAVSSPTPAVSSLISGSISEMPLPDLLQLFDNSRKSGVLTIRSTHGIGRIYLREGQVYHAEVEANPVVKPRKAFYRMFAWTEGAFDLKPLREHVVAEEITESTTSLVLEGVRQLDEIRILERKVTAARCTVTRGGTASGQPARSGHRGDPIVPTRVGSRRPGNGHRQFSRDGFRRVHLPAGPDPARFCDVWMRQRP